MADIQKKTFRKWFRLASITLQIAGALNRMMPFLLKSIVNRQLSKIPGHTGQIKSLAIGMSDISVKINGLWIDRKGPGEGQVRFISIDSLEIKLDKKSLWDGILDMNVKADAPSVILMKDMDLKPYTVSLHPDIKLKIDSCQISNGKIEYIDITAIPKVDMNVTNITFSGGNIANASLPFEGRLSASLYQGLLTAHVLVDPMGDVPTFDLTSELKGLDLTQLNNFFDAYGHFTLSKGNLDLYSEIAAKEGKFAGYLKPFAEDLEFLGAKEREEGLGRKMWEGILGVMVDIFKSSDEDAVASKIPISGTFEDPNVNVFSAILSTFRNAFVGAICACIDHDVNMDTVNRKRA